MGGLSFESHGSPKEKGALCALKHRWTIFSVSSFFGLIHAYVLNHQGHLQRSFSDFSGALLGRSRRVSRMASTQPGVAFPQGLRFRYRDARSLPFIEVGVILKVAPALSQRNQK